MCVTINAKSLVCELAGSSPVNAEVFILHFTWKGPTPKAGQFFMVKPLRSSTYLGRPLSVCEFNAAQNTVKFLVAKRGRGTEELSLMTTGEKAQLTGPLGNAWEDFLPENGFAALVGGSVGIAPLAALVAEKSNYNFHFYAGFKNGFREKEEENAMLGAACMVKKLIVTAEDGRNALSGRILDYFFEPGKYDVVLACGPLAMLKAVKEKCKTRGAACYVSMENRMACGIGACLGCTVRTVNGEKRCCADGPIFPAQELIFDE